MSTTTPPNASTQLIALAKAYQAAHACAAGTAQSAVLKRYPDLERQHRWEMRHPGQPMPVAKADALSYADMRQTVEVYKAFHHVSTEEAFAALVQDHTPRHPEWAAALRHWQLYEAPAERAQAQVDAIPLTPLTREQITKMVAAMPDPPAQPSMDYLKMR